MSTYIGQFAATAGISGYSGASGYSGISTSGYSGISTSGYSGYSGATGPDIEGLSVTAREERNKRIASDWTQGKDIPQEISDAWVEYRQSLRDISQQAWFPLSIDWPTPP